VKRLSFAAMATLTYAAGQYLGVRWYSPLLFAGGVLIGWILIDVFEKRCPMANPTADKEPIIKVTDTDGTFVALTWVEGKLVLNGSGNIDKSAKKLFDALEPYLADAFAAEFQRGEKAGWSDGYHTGHMRGEKAGEAKGRREELERLLSIKSVPTLAEGFGARAIAKEAIERRLAELDSAEKPKG
jgi:hypothetical protein